MPSRKTRWAGCMYREGGRERAKRKSCQVGSAEEGLMGVTVFWFAGVLVPAKRLYPLMTEQKSLDPQSLAQG